MEGCKDEDLADEYGFLWQVEVSLKFMNKCHQLNVPLEEDSDKRYVCS